MAINAVLWVRDPYPFRTSEQEALQEALRKTYGGSIVHLKEWPAHCISIDNTNISTCRQIASTLKVIHRQWAIQDNSGRIYCTNLEVDIRGIADGRPEWAREK